MKLFVLGGSGYVGSVIVEKLVGAGHNVVGLARSENSDLSLRANGAVPIRGSLESLDLISEQARAADGVVQITTGGYLTEVVNGVRPLEGAIAAISDGLAGSGKPFIFTGGTGRYADTGIVDPDRVVSETDNKGVFYFYEHLIPAIEDVTSRVNRGFRPVVLHIGQMYGRMGGYIGPVARQFHLLRTHGNLFWIPTKGKTSYADVDDVADAYCLALTTGSAYGHFNLATDDVAMVDLMNAVLAFGGIDHKLIETNPAELFDKAGWMAVLDQLNRIQVSSERARSELKWTPSRPGLLEHLAALKKTHDLKDIYPGRRISGFQPSVMPGERHS